MAACFLNYICQDVFWFFMLSILLWKIIYMPLFYFQTSQKVRLVDFEERFEDKVSQVDAKYRDRLEELMAQNIELK